MNECATDIGCDANAECTNTEGNFTCACRDSYFGDGFNYCISKLLSQGSHQINKPFFQGELVQKLKLIQIEEVYKVISIHYI